MKFSTQEEYGLRCLIQIGRQGTGGSLTIPEISGLEGLSEANVAKLVRILRMGGFLVSERGKIGGYALARKPEDIYINDVLGVLGGRLFGPEFCDSHAGTENLCIHTVDCSVRYLWQTIQRAVDQVLGQLTLRDLIGPEGFVDSRIQLLARETGTART